MENKVVNDFNEIKKYYGENMAKLCRELFPTILEEPGLMFQLLSSHFAYSKELFEDIGDWHKMSFRELINMFYDEIKEKEKPEEIEEPKPVKELLAEKGYRIFECKDNDDIHRFRKYYAPNEELCTFRDPTRIDDYMIFFIVRNDADRVKRSTHPSREDAYSTSVLDLQFERGNVQRVSIKSRYNHTVDHPDSTYGNKLDAIAKGLTRAFERDYGFHISAESKSDFHLDDYIEAKDGRLYKYNFERDNIYYGSNNMIIDNNEVVADYADKGRYIVINNSILDIQEKRMFKYQTRKEKKAEEERRKKAEEEGKEFIPKKQELDVFQKLHQNISNVQVRNLPEGKEATLQLTDGNTVVITLNKDNRLIGYRNDKLEEVGDNFLREFRYLKKVELPSLRKCGKDFLNTDNYIDVVDFPNLEECGDNFISSAHMEVVNLPKLKRCGSDFLRGMSSVQSVDLPELEVCGNHFMSGNMSVRSINLPKLKECGDHFFSMNSNIKIVDLPSLEICGDHFMDINSEVRTVNLPNLRICGEKFLLQAGSLKKIEMPSLKKCGDFFLGLCDSLTSASFPALEECGSDFITNNEVLKRLDVHNLIKCGDGFLTRDTALTSIIAPNLIEAGDLFLSCANEVKSIDFSSLEKCGKQFLEDAEYIKIIDMPNLIECGDNFFGGNHSVRRINLPRLKKCGDKFLVCSHDLTDVDLPSLEECGENFMPHNYDLRRLNVPRLHSSYLTRYGNESIKKFIEKGAVREA